MPDPIRRSAHPLPSRPRRWPPSPDGSAPDARPGEAARHAPLELWAGVECTLNRVGDEVLDQQAMSGHADRLDDLDRIAELGVRTLRMPVLWERVASDPGRAPDWREPDARLGRLRALGMRPIAGLVHHGSGPRHAPLGSDAFAPALGRYAACVATRYPWIEDWTPVNEPLTTARFAGLYGLWHPHGTDPACFARCLMGEIEGTVAAMRAIRRCVPHARLVQTDDLGRIWSTAPLAGVAEFENLRRWLGWDLLCGHVDRTHPFHGWLRDAGVPADALARLVDQPCPPDVIGINHYLTSERFLDHEVGHYPAHTHRQDGPCPFADVEAVRVLAPPLAGLAGLLLECWQRYGLPIAVTEAHLGCTREEQMRWLRDTWNAALAARTQGADVRALTVWALFGSFDWHRLLTVRTGHYECGVFDVRTGSPRPTALADTVRALAAGREPEHPAMAGDGWWHRPIRLVYPPRQPVQDPAVASVHRAAGGQAADSTPTTPIDDARSPHDPAAAPDRAPLPWRREQPPPPLLVLGGTGTLGGWFVQRCALRGVAHRAVGRPRVDIGDIASIERALDELRPWAVINCAGYVRVDEAERDRDACFRANARGPALLARACAKRRIRLATFSTDLVFDGRQEAPYLEHAAPSPLNVYGLSKLEAERRVLDTAADALVVRTSAFFSPTDRWNFVHFALDALARGDEFRAAADLVVSPTYVPDLVDATLDLLIDRAHGLRHLVNEGSTSWAALAQHAARLTGFDPGRVIACSSRELGLVAPRPAYSALSTAHGRWMPELDDALQRFAAERSSRATPLGFPRPPGRRRAVRTRLTNPADEPG